MPLYTQSVFPLLICIHNRLMKCSLSSLSILETGTYLTYQELRKCPWFNPGSSDHSQPSQAQVVVQNCFIKLHCQGIEIWEFLIPFIFFYIHNTAKFVTRLHLGLYSIIPVKLEELFHFFFIILFIFYYFDL